MKTIEKIKSECKKDIDVQLILSDGLSSTAIEANAAKILPALEEGLKDKGALCGRAPSTGQSPPRVPSTTRLWMKSLAPAAASAAPAHS